MRTLERRIEMINHICSEYKDSLVIFELPEENRNEGMPIDISSTPLLQKDVCLVKQQYRIPHTRKFKYACQALV
jgi:hypothetical protein